VLAVHRHLIVIVVHRIKSGFRKAFRCSMARPSGTVGFPNKRQRQIVEPSRRRLRSVAVYAFSFLAIGSILALGCVIVFGNLVP